MGNCKVKPTPPLRRWATTRSAGVLCIVLGSLVGCSQALKSKVSAEPATTKNDLIASNPWGDQTPAQRRAAWLKREPQQQTTASIAQDTATTHR